jgi:hypothetical protein
MAVRNYNGEAMRTITVRDLIALLEDEDQDKKVVFSTCYGDYHRTQQALPLRGEVEEVLIEKSAYSNSGFAIADNDDDEENDEVYLVIR